MAALKPFADDLETELTCSICQEIFNQPKTLTCLHSFCTNCIGQWYEKSGNKSTKRFDCPVCKTRIDVPEGDGSKLRSSFYLDSLLQIFKAMRAKSDQQQPAAEVSGCECCEKHLDLVAFCPQCAGLICNECVNAHRTVKQLRLEHQAQMLDDFKQENVESFVKNQMFCQERFHERNKLEYYCKEKTCKKCICQKCAILNHQHHGMLSIEEAAEQARIVITQDLERVNKVKEKYEAELAQSQLNMARIESDIERATQKVDDVVESIVKMARDHKATMMKELNGILTEQREANKGEQSDIKAAVNEIAEFLIRCKTLLDKGAANEISVTKEELQQKCQSYSEIPLILSSKPIQRNVNVCYVTDQEVMRSLQNVGRVVENVTDPLRCTIESLIKEVTCGFMNGFVVMSRNSEDEVCHTDKGSIAVSIKDTEGNEVEGRIIEDRTGNYIVSYRPEKAVRYEVQVNIGGQPIKNSPQKINALRMEFTHVKCFSGVELRQDEAEEDKVEAEERDLPDDLFLMHRTISLSNVNKEIAVADTRNQSVNIFDLDGNFLRSFTTVCPGIEGSEKSLPVAAVYNENKLIVCLFNEASVEESGIHEFDLNGNLRKTICGADHTFIPLTCCVTEDRNLAVCGLTSEDEDAKPCVKLLSEQGHFIRNFEDMQAEKDLFFLTYDNEKLFVSNVVENRIRVFDKNGAFVHQFGEEGALFDQFDGVAGHAGYGPDMILVCDVYNHRVQVLSTYGEFITSFSTYGSYVMQHPFDVAVAADGKVFVVQIDGTVHIWR